MQNYCKNIGALAAASALVAGTASAGTPSAPAPAPAPQSSVAYDLHVGYTTEYLWRGVDLGNSLEEAGVNVKTEYNGIGLSAGAWYGSYEGRDHNTHQVDELDLYGEVSKDFGFATVAMGYIYYFNQDDHEDIDDAQELYFSLSRDFGFAKASLAYYWDIEQGDNDGYSELGLSRSFSLNNCLTLNVGTNVGYLVEEAEFTAWTTKVALDWNFVGNAKLSPFVALSIALGDTDDDGGTWEQTDNEFVAGSMLSVTF